MLVSIIIPVYNCGKYIGQAIKSLLNQSYKNIEIIVVDDGSTDNTKSVLSEFQGQIRYYYKENGGEASARNFGLSKAKGDFIAFLDADDYYDPFKVEKQVNIMLRHPEMDVVYTDVMVVDEKDNLLNIARCEHVYENQADFYAQMIYRQMIPGTAAMMLRRKCVEQGLRYPEKYTNSVDYAFSLQLAEKYRFYYLAEPLYFYRRHMGNLTNQHERQVQCEKQIVKDLGIEKIKQAVAKTSFSDDEKHLLMSRIFQKMNDYKNALDEIQKVRKKTWESIFQEGVCLYFHHEYESALKCFLLNIEIEPLRAETYNNVACCYHMLGDKKNSKLYWKKAKGIRPEYFDPEYNLNDFNKRKKLTERPLRRILTNYVK